MGGGCEGGDWEMGLKTHEAILQWLKDSDLVFAYIDGPNPYGTILEIGIAVALNIPVYLAFGLVNLDYDVYGEPVDVQKMDIIQPSDPLVGAEFLRSIMNDAWLAARFARKTALCGSAQEAWTKFKKWNQQRINDLTLIEGLDEL
jgi:nucleoside 2-deoxyribosyltransferase